MKKLTLLLFFIFSYSLLAQSPWTLKKDTWYTQVNFTKIGPYNELFVNGSETGNTSRELNDNTLQFYAEYGLDDKTTLQLVLPFKFISTGDAVGITNPIIIEDQVNAFGNIGFGIKRKLFDGAFVVSTSLAIEANTSTYDPLSGIRTGYDAWTFLPSIAAGKGGERYFIQSNLGLGFRTNNYSHFVKIGVEGGYKFFNRLWTILYVDVKESFQNGSVISSETNLATSLYVDNQEYFGYGLKAIFEVSSNFGFTGGLGGAFSANFEARRAALNIGAYYKFGKKTQ